MELVYNFVMYDYYDLTKEELEARAQKVAEREAAHQLYTIDNIIVAEKPEEVLKNGTRIFRVEVFGKFMSEQEVKEDLKKIQTEVKQELGTKHDQGKWSISLLPNEGIIETAKAFGYGASKYKRDNYRAGMQWSRLIDASIRHLLAFKEGEDLDKESSLNHIAHASASIMMLLYNIENKPELDDRWKNPKN